MTSTLRYSLVLLVILALLTANAAASNSRPPRNNDISNMADALKYLQDLDTYYGDRARVRFGKRNYLAQLLRNRLNSENSDPMAHTIEYPGAAAVAATSAVDEPF